MNKTNKDYCNEFNQRNQSKELKGFLYSFLSGGTNCSELESRAIAEEMINKLTLFLPDAVIPGKLVYNAVAINEPAGKSIQDCDKVSVFLTLLDTKEDNIAQNSKL